jgi:hypothetical protein
VSAFITVSTTVIITAVTAAVTAAITDAIIISGLLLSYLPLVGRSDLGYGQRKDAVELFCRRDEDEVTCVPLGICFPFFYSTFTILYLAILL